MSSETERRVTDRLVAQSSAGVRLSRHLWTLFWVVVGLQALDLATTYVALATRQAHEGNPIFRGLLFTPGAPVFKVFALVFLAILIVRSTNWEMPAPGRLLTVTRLIVLFYLGIVANNVILLLRAH